MNRRVVLHAIDATLARWRGDAGSSPLDGANTAASPEALVDFRTGRHPRVRKSSACLDLSTAWRAPAVVASIRARARRRRRSAPRRLCRSPPSERAVRTTTGRRAWVGAASSSGRRRWRPGPKTRACSRPGAASRRDPRAPAEGPPLQPLGQPLPRRTRPPPGVACSPVLPLVASECASVAAYSAFCSAFAVLQLLQSSQVQAPRARSEDVLHKNKVQAGPHHLHTMRFYGQKRTIPSTAWGATDYKKQRLVS